MSNARRRPKPEELGEGPESRMRNFPAKTPRRNDRTPGAQGPADAVGEGAVEEMVEGMPDVDVRLREQDTQKDNIRAAPDAPPPRRRKSRPKRRTGGRRA